MIDREFSKAAFYKYTSAYDHDNILIMSKINHTLRVADICGQIAKSLDMDAELTDCAWFLGLLHDVGRFEQLKRYATFVDAVSMDHAEFGADLLFKEKLIGDLSKEELPAERLNMFETAIRLHNKLALPQDLDELTRRFCEILRDADKVDIFRATVELTLDNRSETSAMMPLEADGAIAGDVVMDFVRRHECIPRSIRQNPFEIHISHCCLAFDMVFPESRRITVEQGYLGRLLSINDTDEDSLWTKEERSQLDIVRKEIENAWDCSFTQ